MLNQGSEMWNHGYTLQALMRIIVELVLFIENAIWLPRRTPYLIRCSIIWWEWRAARGREKIAMNTAFLRGAVAISNLFPMNCFLTNEKWGAQMSYSSIDFWSWLQPPCMIVHLLPTSYPTGAQLAVFVFVLSSSDRPTLYPTNEPTLEPTELPRT